MPKCTKQGFEMGLRFRFTGVTVFFFVGDDLDTSGPKQGLALSKLGRIDPLSTKPQDLQVRRMPLSTYPLSGR